MKKVFFIGIISILSLSSLGQEYNKVVVDTTIQKEILYGYCDIDGLKSSFFSEYFNLYYDSYEVDQLKILFMKEHIYDISITVLFGSWCSDSQMQLPHFIKILEALDYSVDGLSMIGLNRQKEHSELDIQSYNVELVPTFIVYKYGKEIGRIIESPQVTLEEDLLSILLSAQ